MKEEIREEGRGSQTRQSNQSFPLVSPFRIVFVGRTTCNSKTAAVPLTHHDIVSIPCDLTRSAHARDDGYRTLNDDTIVDNVTVHVA